MKRMAALQATGGCMCLACAFCCHPEPPRRGASRGLAAAVGLGGPTAKAKARFLDSLRSLGMTNAEHVLRATGGFKGLGGGTDRERE